MPGSLGPSPWLLVQLSLTPGGLYWDKFIGAPYSRPGNTTSGSKLQPAHCPSLTRPRPRVVTALQEACSSPHLQRPLQQILFLKLREKASCQHSLLFPKAVGLLMPHPSASSLQTLYIRSSLKEKWEGKLTSDSMTSLLFSGRDGMEVSSGRNIKVGRCTEYSSPLTFSPSPWVYHLWIAQRLFFTTPLFLIPGSLWISHSVAEEVL